MRLSAMGERLPRGCCHTLKMQEPQITYRGMPSSPAMDARILEHVAKLEELHPKITSCKVVINEADKHKSKGNQFEVRVDLHMPGRDIVATNQRHEDAYVAINEAFDVLIRQLEDKLEIQRGEVKVHREERGDSSTP
jgi:ribosomal subunit interface protein